MIKFLWVPIVQRHARRLAVLLAQQLQAAGKVKKFLKNHPPPGDLHSLLIRWEMDIFIGVTNMAQAVFLAERLVQVVCHRFCAFQSLADSLTHRPSREAGRQPVNRQNAAGDRLPVRRIKFRVNQLFAQQGSSYPAKKHIFFSLAQLVFHIRLIEIDQVHGASLVENP